MTVPTRVPTTPPPGVPPARIPAAAPATTSATTSAATSATRPVTPTLGARLRSALRGSPGRLRIIAALTAAVVASFGIIAANTLWTSSTALQRADLNLTQLVRVQAIQSDLLQADASATNAFLAGGDEPAAQRIAYDQAIARVTAGIAQAAGAQPADTEALATLNGQVQQYTARVEEARALNRQGLPVGATYLRDASDGLNGQAMPVLGALRDANQDRLDAELGASGAPLPLVLAGLLALVILALTLVYLARRSHRVVNVPLTVGAGLVVIALVVGISTLGTVRGTVKEARAQSVAATRYLARAEASAFDAKASESLWLILQGTAGVTYDARSSSSSADVTGALGQVPASLSVGLTEAWATYAAEHKKIRETEKADYEAARSAAGDTGDGSANRLFTVATDGIGRQLGASQVEASSALAAPRTPTTLVGWLLLALCLAAAVLALRGVGQRLEEYR